MNIDERKTIGEEGELKCIEFLEKHGFKVLNRSARRNFDILAEKNGFKYSIEVKSGELAKKATSIISKLERYGKAALMFYDGDKIHFFAYLNFNDNPQFGVDTNFEEEDFPVLLQFFKPTEIRLKSFGKEIVFSKRE